MNSIPQASVKRVLCRLISVQGAAQVVPYVAGFTDTMTYTVDIYTDDGWYDRWPGITPAGQRWPRPFMVRPPSMTPDTEGEFNYAAWCDGCLYNDDLFVFVTEVPDWAPCQTTDPTQDVPIGDSTPIGDRPPINRNPTPTGLGLLGRLLLQSTPAELKSLAAAMDAVRGDA